MKKCLLFVFCMIVMALPAHADDHLTIDLAYDHVDITTGFTGASVVVFGSRPSRGTLAVTLEGPKSDLVLRKKESVLGAWLNRRWLEYKDVPLYYDYALEENQDETPLEYHKVGQAALKFQPQDKRRYNKEQIETFQKALVSLRQEAGLFAKSSKNIKPLRDNLFRVDFQLPANVPKGKYTVKGFNNEW